MAAFVEGNSLRLYRQNMTSLAPLERDVEREIAKAWRLGDRRAGEQLVEACLPFVISIALEYRRWGVPIEDIIQQGNLGLLRAAAKFDPDRECRLATYAAYWIRAEIREYVVRAYRVVRLGTTKGERRALRAYRTTHETDPEKLAAVSGLSPERIAVLLPLLAARETSLDAAANDNSPVGDRLSADGPTPEDNASASEGRQRAGREIAKALATLSERERMIVKARMMNDEPVTLQELGTKLGVSKERVRQIEERARGKLRAQLEGLREMAEAI